MDFDHEGLVESDAGHPEARIQRRYPWERQDSTGEVPAQAQRDDSSQQPPSPPVSSSSPESNENGSRSNGKTRADLTREETRRLNICMGNLTNWLMGSSCKTISVPRDLRTHVRELFIRNPAWMLKLEGEKGSRMLERLKDLHVISPQQMEIYQTQGIKSTPGDDFLDYLFRRGIRAVLNFTMVLYEEEKLEAVVSIVEHIAKRGYVPNETTSPERTCVSNGGGSRTYPMKSRPRGYVLLINNEEFTHSGGAYGDRAGTHVDGDNLCALFVQLGFEIFEKRQFWNKTKTQMVQIVRDFAGSSIHHNADAVVVCILSHGTTKGRISGTDGEHVTDSEIEGYFGPNECKGLAGKPKIFLFVACRGGERDLGMKISQSSPASTDRLRESPPSLASSSAFADGSDVVADTLPSEMLTWSVQTDERGPRMRNNSGPQDKISNSVDFITVHSTVPDHLSLRHTKDGTFFVQEFVKVLAEEAHMYDFQTMLAEVNNRLGQLSHKGEMQTMVFSSTLRKNLFFNPGY
ncbi:hypothetical protein RvY_08963-2 [Ramazzottius varieornatus]|uniref:Caspase family p20 domain-containing protein n=1 Tax=Ramazzottius varieornatus TaxID=947166 RepID=A0A1D1VFN7_RAMVA|nr:hypothetical protein RvY_08963-2 [Ramazzottius varieornatus]